MRALVVYGTSEGHTRKIAEWISDWLRERHISTLTVDSGTVPRDFDASGFDLYILAGSVHMGKHQPSLARFAKANRDILSKATAVLISASGSGGRTDPKSQAEAEKYIDLFEKETGWSPTATMPIGGALLFTQYNFFLRWVMKSISKSQGGPTDTSKDYELTNWQALGSFLSGLLSSQCFKSQPELRRSS